jgi:hypothetical protein
MSDWLKKLSAAVTTVAEAKKMDPVNKKALKKDFDDRDDKDIDNDGDVDSSDKYLHNRRKTISKATGKGKETETQVDEAAPKMKGDSFKQEREKARAHDAAMGRTPTGRKKPVRQMTSTQRSLASLRKEEVEQIDENKALMKDYQGLKAQGKSDSSIMDILMSMAKYKRMNKDQMRKIIGDAKRKGIFKEETELDEAAIQPATRKGYQDPMDKGLSPSAKVELGRTTDAPSDAFDANKVIAKTFKDMRASLKNKKMRPGDQATGDKAPVKNDGK